MLSLRIILTCISDRYRRIHMKQIEEKLKRKVKYWRVSYMQASNRDRLLLGAFMLIFLTYAWWMMLVF